MKEVPSLFPPMFCEMLAIGEQTASIPSSLEKIASQYDREVSHALQKVSAAIEPLAIVFVGIMVGFLAFAVMDPIMRMSEAF